MINYLIFDQIKNIKKELYFESYEFSNFKRFFGIFWNFMDLFLLFYFDLK